MAEKQLDDVKINVEFSEEQELKGLNSGEGLSVLMGKLAKAVKELIAHLADNVRHITASERANWNGKANGTHGHSAVSQSAAGFMSADDKKKLDGIAAGANNYTYTLPAAGSTVRGGVKVGYTANGKNYPVQLSNEQMYVNVPWTDNNTTYSAATQSAAGLMSADDKKKLDGIAENVNNNINLIDNPDFKIRLRGVTSVQGGYAADRWHGSYTVDDTGITLSGSIRQRYETNWFKQLNGKVATLSISIDGTVHSGSALITPINGTTDKYDTSSFISSPFEIDIYRGSGETVPELRFFGAVSGHHIEWVKLEPGSKATTYIPPNPALELLKCQRYYWKSQPAGSMHSSIFVPWGNGRFLCLVHPPVTMRITPTVKINGVSPGETLTMRSTITGHTITGTLKAFDAFKVTKDGLIFIELINATGATDETQSLYEGTVELLADL